MRIRPLMIALVGLLVVAAAIALNVVMDRDDPAVTPVVAAPIPADNAEGLKLLLLVPVPPAPAPSPSPMFASHPVVWKG